MKSSSQKNFLSPQELDDYLKGNLSGKEKSRVKKLLEDCELSQEAVAGFTAMPLATGDIPSLKKSIASKAGMKAPYRLQFFTYAVGIVMLGGMVYAIWPREPEVIKVQPVMNYVPVPNTNSPQISDVDLKPSEEHFVNPEMNLTPKAVIASDIPKDSSNEKVNETKPITTTEQIKSIDTTFVVRPVVPVHPEVGYNASVGFIFDLKITEFSNYYRKTIRVDETELTGVSAQYDNFASEKMDNETVREIPADQFLKEGLQAFHDGHYGKCIEKMEVLQKNNANDLNAIFYIAVSDVKLEMYAKAIPLFDQILNAQNNVFHEEANWYKALALIGNGNVDAAKKVLTEISTGDGFYKEKAAAKLKEI